MAYQGTFTIRVDITTNFMSGLPPWTLVDRPDPLVQRISGQIMNGYSEFVVDIYIFTHQSVMKLEGLDPPLKPAQSQIIAGEFQYCQPGNPLRHLLEMWMLSEIRDLCPAVFHQGGAVDKFREANGSIQSDHVLVIEPTRIPVTGGFMRRHHRILALRAEHEGHTPTVIHVSVLDLFLDFVVELEKLDLRSDPKMAFEEGSEVG